jgi:hypothetical protein
MVIGLVIGHWSLVIDGSVLKVLILMGRIHCDREPSSASRAKQYENSDPVSDTDHLGTGRDVPGRFFVSQKIITVGSA